MGPLSPAGDAVSEYPQDIDYERDVRDNFAAFDLEVPRLTRALSTEPPGVETIVEAGPWDVIYIDGSHDEDPS